MNPLKMVQYGVLAGVVAMAISLKVLWGWYSDVKAHNVVLEAQIEVNETNMKLLTSLLDDERENREAAQIALSELAKEVPDVVYSQELPPSIQGVLNRFHDRIR